MRYFPTPDAVVERLKKQAKKLQRAGGGKHADLLNRVAKQAGYDHWHHVVQCNEAPAAAAAVTRDLRTIIGECEAIVAAELRGQAKVVMTGRDLEVGPFVLFSTGVGDAWLLEPDEGLAMCLVWQGGRQELGIRDDPARMEIAWDGAYELLGDFFRIESEHPQIGERAIAGYPLSELRKLIDRAQSFEAKFDAVIAQADAVEITPDVIAHLVQQERWSEAEIVAMKSRGFRYSPSRDSLIGPVASSPAMAWASRVRALTWACRASSSCSYNHFSRARARSCADKALSSKALSSGVMNRSAFLSVWRRR